MTIRVLRLGSSIDLEGETPPDQRAQAIAALMLEQAAREPVETAFRTAWPSPSMADNVERWLEETRPDMVCLNISSFWCESEVVAKRLRDFGRVGRWLARRLDTATRRYSFNSRLFVRLARGAAAYTAGGRPPFEPAAATATIEATLRRIVRHEHIAVVVAGSPFSASLDGGPPARRRAGRRRAEFFGRLQSVCDSLHVPHELPGHAPDAFDKSIRTRDGLHFGPEMHRRCGEIQGRLLAAAWHASQAPRPPHIPTTP